jgi:hypothetical protein
MSDTYPGDRAYTQIIEDLRDRVSRDRIVMQFWQGGAVQSRSQVCQLLVQRHNSGSNRGQSQTNSAFLGQSLTGTECTNALIRTRGYSSPAGWTEWAGLHQGTWYGDAQFPDSARWLVPRREPTRSPGSDLDRSRQARVYDFQPVEFLNRTGAARNGWNQSHPEVSYVWGWDPKEGQDERGQNGAHIGFPLQVGTVSCLIWFTPKEAFLECIKRTGTGRVRTSTGLFGFGQWTVT